MNAVRPSVILVSGQDRTAIEEIRRLLQQEGHAVHCQPPGEPVPDGVSYHLAIVDASGWAEESLVWCGRLRARPVDSFLPILFITPDHSPAARLASFEAGADTCLLRPFASEELLAQVRAFLRIRDVHDRLAEKTAEVHRVNRRLQQAYQQFDQE